MTCRPRIVDAEHLDWLFRARRGRPPPDLALRGAL